MTLFLIVVIIFLGVWLNDSANKQKDKNDYKKSTITDVKTEVNLYAKWIEIIDNELKEVHDNYSDWTKWNTFETWTPIDVLDNLYIKYGIPYLYAHEPPSKKEEWDRTAKRDFRRTYEDFKKISDPEKIQNWKNETIMELQKKGYYKIRPYGNLSNEQSEKETIYYSEDLIKKIEKAQPVYYLGAPHNGTGREVDLLWEDRDLAVLDSWNSDFHYVYEPNNTGKYLNDWERERARDANGEWIVDTYKYAKYAKQKVEEVSRFKQKGMFVGMCCKFDQTTYSYIMNSSAAAERYRRLVKLLVQKELAGYGFNPSPNIMEKKESAWQEREEKQKRFEDQQKRYPWL